MLGIRMERTETVGDLVTIDCPRCSSEAARAQVIGIHERSWLLYVVPWFSVDLSRVECHDCGKSMRIMLPMHRVPQLERAGLSRRLAEEISLPARVLSVLAMVFAVLPVVGLGISVIAVALTHRTPGRWRVFAAIGLAVSILLPVTIFLYFLMTQDWGAWRDSSIDR